MTDNTGTDIPADVPVLRFPIVVTDLPPTGQDFRIEATDEECSRLASAYGLLSVSSVAATGHVERAGKVFRVRGRVEAGVTQPCIVTLEPVEGRVVEDIAVDFVAQADAERLADTEAGPDEPDPPDIMHDNVIDVGILVEEHLALGLDPYPRAPGAEIGEEFAGGDKDERESPFAALAGLRGGGGATTSQQSDDED